MLRSGDGLVGHSKGGSCGLRTTPYARLDGWVDCQNGYLTYSDGKPWGMIEFYRKLGAQTEADLLWLVFVRNRDGITWCGIEQNGMQRTTCSEHYSHDIVIRCQKCQTKGIAHLGRVSLPREGDLGD